MRAAGHASHCDHGASSDEARPCSAPTPRAVVAALRALSRGACCCGPGVGHSAPATLAAPARAASAGIGCGGDGRVARVESFLLPDVTVVNPGVGRRSHVDVCVEHGRITSVDPAGTAARAPHVAVLDGHRGAFVLPGLVDMHGHLPPDNLLDLGGTFAVMHLAHGVTAVRDAGDVDGTAMPAIVRGLAAGRFDGPRFFPAGPFVTAGTPRWPNSVIVRAPDDAPGIVRDLVAAGSRAIKLYENLTVPMIRRLVDEARAAGLNVLGHVPTPLGVEEAGVPDAQHFFGVPPPASLRRDHVVSRAVDWDAVDDERLRRIVDAAVTQHLANTPTLVSTTKLLAYERYEEVAAADDGLPRLYREVVWHPVRGLPSYRGLGPDDFRRARQALDKKRRLVAMLAAAGAPLHLGTDVQQPFVVPGRSLHEEMRLFVDAGVATEHVWQMATRNAADALGAHDLGRVEPGAVADLGVYRDDPSGDLGALASLRAVVADGALFESAALAARLDAERRAHEGFFFEWVAPLLARLALWRAARNFVG